MTLESNIEQLELRNRTLESTSQAFAEKKSGGGILNAIAAPFKAIGSVFSRGSKKEEDLDGAMFMKRSAAPEPELFDAAMSNEVFEL